MSKLYYGVSLIILSNTLQGVATTITQTGLNTPVIDKSVTSF
jgi:hypothetical protein